MIEGLRATRILAALGMFAVAALLAVSAQLSSPTDRAFAELDADDDDECEMTVEKSNDASGVLEDGDEFTWEIFVEWDDDCDDDAEPGYNISDNIPDGLDIDDFDNDCELSGSDTVECQVDDLPDEPGDDTFEIDVIVDCSEIDEDDDEIENTVNLDPDLADDTDDSDSVDVDCDEDDDPCDDEGVFDEDFCHDEDEKDFCHDDEKDLDERVDELVNDEDDILDENKDEDEAADEDEDRDEDCKDDEKPTIIVKPSPVVVPQPVVKPAAPVPAPAPAPVQQQPTVQLPRAGEGPVVQEDSSANLLPIGAGLLVVAGVGFAAYMRFSRSR
jgi:hypothetical protein